MLVLAWPAGAVAQDRGTGQDSRVRAAEPVAGFVYQSVEIDGREYPYAVYRPRGLDASTPAPSLVFLHGAGECGTDGSKQLAVGLGPAVMFEPDRWPFVIIFPQKPSWGSEWEDHDRAILAMLDRAESEQNVDPDRVAITGLSQGGHGTIQIAAKHPDRFRAAAPVCGYVQRAFRDGKRIDRAPLDDAETERLAQAYSTVPTWLFHGGRDDVVPPSESETLHGILKDAGLETKLTIYPDAGHNSWDKAYRESGLWDWLVEQTRAR